MIHRLVDKIIEKAIQGVDNSSLPESMKATVVGKLLADVNDEETSRNLPLDKQGIADYTIALIEDQLIRCDEEQERDLQNGLKKGVYDALGIKY